MKQTVVVLFLLIINHAFSQKAPEYIFPGVTEADLNLNAYTLDINAPAVILADVGKTEIINNGMNWFGFEFNRHKRIHILNRAGYDLANMEIQLYSKGENGERLISVKATTYNLDNGKIKESKLDKASVYTVHANKNVVIKKFTLPAVKEGSVIDIEYTIRSDYLFNLPSWIFQSEVPTLWSDYKLALPEFLKYIFLRQGFYPYFINEKDDRIVNFRVSDNRGTGTAQGLNFTATITDYRWAMKDVPALNKENFVSTTANYVSKIDFHLSGYRYPLTEQEIIHPWSKVAEELLERPDFGKDLIDNDAWIQTLAKGVVKNSEDSLAVAKNIYAYVRDNFVCTNHDALYTTQSLKNVAKRKRGNVAEINLFLTALLKHEGFTAAPVILSTRSNGFAYKEHAILDRFNYVVCRAEIDGIFYFLDASYPLFGFGKLSYSCYNGWARIIDSAATAIDLNSDLVREKKLTSLILIGNRKEWMGNFMQELGDYNSYKMRDKVKNGGEGEYFESIRQDFGNSTKTEFQKIDSLKSYDAPVRIQYKFSTPLEANDFLYIKPFFGEAKQENPFDDDKRIFPVEMPYTIDETLIATIYLPEGYSVESLPKPVKVKLNENEQSYFEYAIEKQENIISLRSVIKLDRAYYVPAEYELLRKFYAMIVEKHSERIVLRKKE